MSLENIIKSVNKIDNDSARALNKIKKMIAGGASSTMRVLPYHKPLVISKADGAYVWSVEGNKLLDFNMGYGPLLFGHRSELIDEAIKKELGIRGAVLGYATELYYDVASLIKDAYPSVDLLRFSSSGTEVVQTAVRLARAFTGRKEIILFEGHYHGSSDSVYHKYSATVEELISQKKYRPIQGTQGMCGAPFNAYVLPWNDLELLESFLAENGKNIAAVLMEPVMGNSGVIPPGSDYLSGVRKLTEKYGIVLIFDEIITGFRIARGGAQERYGVYSDITTFSKAMTGGFPTSAIGGRKEIMELLSNGSVFHGGVYSGNPLSLAVTLATQKEYKSNGDRIYRHLEEISDIFANGLKNIFAEKRIPVLIQKVGAMLSLRFLKDKNDAEINNYRDSVLKTDPLRYIIFQHHLQDAGVYIHPNHIEPLYFATAHTKDIVGKALEIIRNVVDTVDFSATLTD